MGKSIKEWIESFISMIYPEVCEICGDSLVYGEKTICSRCNMDMPRTLIHNDNFNYLHKRLLCHCPIERAGALFYYYKNDSYARLIHKLKYNGRREIGINLGALYAKELNPDGFFNGIDLLLPVPMHWIKQMSRGYNQTMLIAEGISSVTNIPIGDHLIATRSHSTQTRKGALERWKNSEGIYEIRNHKELAGMHVLVIDDVITTGATMIHCCEAIHRNEPTATVSILSLGATKLT